MELWLILLIIIGAIFIFGLVLVYFIITRRKPEVQALEMERPGYGAREMVPFDEEMEEALYKKRIVCPECGEDVDPYDEECPACGSRMKAGIFECSNCAREVDPRDKECPHCGEILLPDPFVCPSCGRPVEADSSRCDSCGARYWSPIRLDEASLKKRTRREEEEKVEEPPEEPPEKPRRVRGYR
ncbi:MAG: zinc ribbon domain-containing protein [Thermoplasmatota archaeon]